MGDRKPIHYRKAIAGAHVLAGQRIGEALRNAGFSPWTAKVPKAKGLSAEECVAETVKLNPDCSPANITRLAAELLADRLRGMKASGEGAKASILALSKVYSIANAVSRPDASIGLMEPKRFLDTAAWLQEMLGEMRSRQAKVEARVPVDSQLESSQEVTATSDNAHCVNSPTSVESVDK